MLEYKGEAVVIIDAPFQTVYDYLADFTRHPDWVKNLSKVQKTTGGPIGVGTRFRADEGVPPASLGRTLKAMLSFMRGMSGGAKSYSEAEITALEPGRRITWTGKVAGKTSDFNRSKWEVVLEPMGSQTRLTQHFHYMPQTEAAHQMLLALGETEGIRQACLTNLKQLKNRLEHPAQQAVTQLA
jgi:uncharacterized protein YndB with AHSA1/START domain